MHPTAIPHGGVLLTADLARLGNEARQVQRAARTGAIHRLRRGAYVDRVEWESADARGRHILRLRAVHSTRRTPPVYSHVSAAALHGLPILGTWPTVAHVSSLAPGHSKNGVLQHLARPGTRVVMIDGLACTSLVDTLTDLALSADFTSTTVSLDHALHAAALAALAPGEWVLRDSESGRIAASELADAVRGTLQTSAPSRGLRKALRALDFASHLSDSPGESVSRCGIHLLGFPAPELQHEFQDYLGRIGWGDFWWEHLRLLGEFDGENKYKDPRFLAGRTSEQAVIDEKWREDRIRATRASVSRWGWATATDLRALYNKLTDAGLRPLPTRPKAL